jgi:hypothetical protein
MADDNRKSLSSNHSIDYSYSPHNQNSSRDQKNSSFNLDSFKKLPNFLDKLNQNIKNIDNMVKSNINKPKNEENNKYNKLKTSVDECNDLKNLVKQSVDGLTGILNLEKKITKHESTKNVSTKNVKIKNNDNNAFEVIKEEEVANMLPRKVTKVNPFQIKSDRKLADSTTVSKKIMKKVTDNSYNNNSNNLINSKLNKNIQLLKDKISSNINVSTNRDKSGN